MNRGKARAFVGFLLTCFLVTALIGTIFFVCLRSSVLRGKDIKSLIKSLDLGEIVQVVVSETVKESTNNSDSKKQISDKLVEALITDDVISDVTDMMVEALTDDKDIDLGEAKASCMAAVTKMSEQTVDDVIDELVKNETVIDAESLKNNSVINQYQKDFNIDITTPILENMQTIYGSKSVNIKDIDVEEAKVEAKEAVKQTVIPAIDKKVNRFIKKTNMEINEELNELRKETNIKGMMYSLQFFLAAITKAVIIGAIVSGLLMILQFIVYKKDINKAFKNIGIAGIFLTIIMFVISKLFEFIRKILISSIEGDEAAVNVIKNIVNRYVPKVESMTASIAMISIIISIALIVAAVVIKKKLTGNDGIDSNQDTFMSGTSLENERT